MNYLGVLRVTRAVAPGMITRGDGMIVNIATAFARVNLPLVGTYCATKAALLSLGQALRAYLSDHNVRVITVMPTTIDTDMSRGANVPKMTKEFVAGGDSRGDSGGATRSADRRRSEGRVRGPCEGSVGG